MTIRRFDYEEFINSCTKQKCDGYTIYYKDGIRYIDKENLLMVDTTIDYTDPNPKYTVKKVFFILDQLKYTQNDLAKELGVTRQAVNNYERRNTIKLTSMIPIQNALYKLCKEGTDGKLFLSMSLRELYYK